MRVSVLIITYNHEEFISQALESALTQETDFAYEVVIGEDSSSDATRHIVLDYERRYPERIRVLLHSQNLGMQENFTRTLAACQGEYVALLDGDDFWLPNKLQYQVDYLTAHPECSMCFHNVKMIYEDQPAHLRHSRREKEYWTLNDIITTNFVATCAAMIRRETAVNLPAWYREMRFEDWPLYILCAEKGLIGYLDEVLAVYRIHSRGAWSGRSAKNQLEEIVLFYEDLNRVLGFKYQKIIKRALSRHYFSFSLASAQDGNSSRSYALKSLQTNPFSVKAAVLLCSPSLFLRARQIYYYFFNHGSPKSPEVQDGK